MDELTLCTLQLLCLCQKTIQGSDFSDLYACELTFGVIVVVVHFSGTIALSAVCVCVCFGTGLLFYVKGEVFVSLRRDGV